MNLFFLTNEIVAFVVSFYYCLPMREGNNDLSIRLKYFLLRVVEEMLIWLMIRLDF